MSLKSHGFARGRLKTGTPPRLDRESIAFDRRVADGTFQVERGDDPPVAFSFLTEVLAQQIVCHLIHTNARVRDLVRANVARSPLFNGQIEGSVAVCPSLEDKIVRFPDRERHQIFLSRKGLDAREIYVNGFSTSLPDVQAILFTRCRGSRTPCCCGRVTRSSTTSFSPQSSRGCWRPSASEACFSPGRSTGHPATRRRPRRAWLD